MLFKRTVWIAFLLLLIEKIFSWAGRKFSLGREQIFAREGTISFSCGCLTAVVKFRNSERAKRYSVTGVTAKSVGWAREGSAPHFIAYLRKKVANCLGVSWEMCIFATEIEM